ncbi:MAG TPA: amidohydrolase family protein [Methylomirabilota bacterium]|jgi:aminocarboxymuconate-semialdehyde decarboxylase|nr:amidohydrolase family protein [Methylomirabilota bacterium]
MIDVHAHYMPPELIERLRKDGARYGVSVVETEPACHALHFGYGLKLRPFFAKLIEEPAKRLASMAATGIEREILSTWTDMHAHGLDAPQGTAWHRLLNESIADFARRHGRHFSVLASGYLPDAAAAARELEFAVEELGAVGAVAATNVEGTNLGELPLDEYWAAAVELGVPVFLHPAQPNPTPRTRRFALNQIVQYTVDTTLCVGSLIGAGVLDRFPALTLILSHGGGTVPYVIGRFDVMFQRSDRAATGIAAAALPSAYLGRLYYDTILHDPRALRYLAERVGVERLVIGSDDSFPPADHDPLTSLRAAGFGAEEIRRIGEDNPRRLFRLG